MGNAANLEILDSVRGRSYLAIQSAMPEFLRRIADVAGYKIVVTKEGNTLTITFVDEEGATGALGNPGNKPGLAVELDAGDLRVLRSYYLR
jgi:hypothetical protein